MRESLKLLLGLMFLVNMDYYIFRGLASLLFFFCLSSRGKLYERLGSDNDKKINSIYYYTFAQWSPIRNE